VARGIFDQLGLEVVPVSLSAGPDALAAYMAITSAACVEPLERYVRTGQAGDEVVRRWELGRALRTTGAAELVEAYAVQGRLADQSAAALTRCDVLFSPTMPTTAPLLTDRTTDLADAAAADLADPMVAPYTDCWTVVANLAGLPSLSLPAGRSSADGMPVGMMLSGRPGSDADLLGLAAELERRGLAKIDK
jgi:aspartyl-tRNA(Asn)/glutamyl-tRNA(Gln) amidotransferase subunit A